MPIVDRPRAAAFVWSIAAAIAVAFPVQVCAGPASTPVRAVRGADVAPATDHESATSSGVSRRQHPTIAPKGRVTINASDLAERDMSTMGLLARMSREGRLADAIARARESGSVRAAIKLKPPLDDDNEPVLAPGGQNEMSIAVDSTGQNVVIGFNDTRGFVATPISTSGYAYSSDGGATFFDGGLLPAPKQGNDGVNDLPQIFGDPDVKYIPGGGGCQFVYASILVVGKGGTGTAPDIVYTGSAQTQSIHRSTDCGVTWSGPYEVSAATEPAASGDAADKEFIDVDPDTGRVLMVWTNFTGSTPAGREIRSTYSDDIMSGSPPTWSASVVIGTGPANEYLQGAVPRFAGNGSTHVYAAWSQGNYVDNPTSSFFEFYKNVVFARSTDNGDTWSVPIRLHTTGELGAPLHDFFPPDMPPGNDRIHSFPTMAVDTTAGTYGGRIYVAYAANDGHDGSDIHFVRSTDGGLTFSTPVRINSSPGSDRSQWFPHLSVTSAGRVYAIWYDQQHSPSGDLTETTATYSDDGGTTWVPPFPLTERAFHAGYGNDTGQPNLGDYIGTTTHAGELYAAWGGNPPAIDYDDGQPASASMTFPNAVFGKTSTRRAPVKLGTIGAQERPGYSNGNSTFDPGEQVLLTVPLINYVTNSTTGAASLSSVQGVLSTTTPGVSIIDGSETYGTIAAGSSSTPANGYTIKLAGSFVAGTTIDLALAVTTSGPSTTLRFRLNTGTPVVTTLLSENFNSTSPGSMPSGWAEEWVGSSTGNPWTTSNTFCNASNNALFKVNTPAPQEYRRGVSPQFSVPSASGPSRVYVDFDICYEIEDAPEFDVSAFDGLTVRFLDNTSGRISRAVLAEAFADVLTTTGIGDHFPKHLPRSSASNYFQDMSVWSGSSGGWRHVRMELPGMNGSDVRMRFEYTQDAFRSCIGAGHAGYGGVCGVAVDNLVIRNVVFNSAQVDLSTTIANLPASATMGDSVNYQFTVLAANTGFNAADATFTHTLPGGVTFVSLSSPAGWSCTTPAVGANGTIQCTHPSVPSNTTGIFGVVSSIGFTTPPGPTSFTGTVSTAQSESNGANNQGTGTLDVVADTSFTGATAGTSGGSGTVTMSGGGAGCTYTSAQWIPLASVPTPPPPGLAFPFGLFEFAASGCASGATLAFTMTLPAPLAPGAAYWKFGPTTGDPTPHWYTIPATIVGNTVTFSITDGGLGDDDLAANGAVSDAGGPTGAVLVSVSATPVPGPGPHLIAGLALVLAVTAFASLRRRRR